MTLPRRISLLLASVAIAAVATTATTIAAPDTQSAGGLKRITAKGAGKVKLGKTYKSLRRAGLIGKMRPGCELVGPRARSATLRAPLEGSVDFSRGKTRRVVHITVLGGAAARGVRVGDTQDDVLQEFPRARVDDSTQDRYGVTLVRVPKSGGGKMDFVIGSGERVMSINLPGVSFCE
jgi:hypothetical protein